MKNISVSQLAINATDIFREMDLGFLIQLVVARQTQE
jgi:hypothetical protein